MQTNIYQNEAGGWTVEFRHEGDRQWTRVGVYGSAQVARATYKRLCQP